MNKVDTAILLVVVLLTSVWCLSTAAELGPTFDEPFYLQGGLEFWRNGRPGMLLRAGTMPFAIQVQTLPLALVEWTTGRPWDVATDLPTMLRIARAGTLVFWWILLFYALRLGHALGGPWAGRLAVLLLALDPTFLANAGLATTDLAVTACLLVFVTHFRAGRELSWGWRVALPALLLALALVTKASSLMFGPLLMLGVELERLGREGKLAEAWAGTWRQKVGQFWTLTHPLRRDGLMVFALGVGLAVVLAGSNFEALPRVEKNLAWLSEESSLKPFLRSAAAVPIWPNGLTALVYQIKHNMIGHATYLLGIEHTHSVWYYFPVLLTMKCTEVTLVLLLIALLAPGRRLNLALALAGVFLVFSLNCRVQIGVRFMLPLMAFLLIGLSVRIAEIAQSLHWPARRVALTATGLLLSFLLLGTARLWPDPLRYVNGLWGGTEQGYRLVSDSNYDWGQGLPELAQWQHEKDVPVAIWYFGTDPRYPHLHRFNPNDESQPVAKLQDRHLAVATSVLHGGYTHSPADRDLKRRLAEVQPVARTRLFLIYRSEDAW